MRTVEEPDTGLGGFDVLRPLNDVGYQDLYCCRCGVNAQGTNKNFGKVGQCQRSSVESEGTLLLPNMSKAATASCTAT